MFSSSMSSRVDVGAQGVSRHECIETKDGRKEMCEDCLNHGKPIELEKLSGKKFIKKYSSKNNYAIAHFAKTLLDDNEDKWEKLQDIQSTWNVFSKEDYLQLETIRNEMIAICND